MTDNDVERQPEISQDAGDFDAASKSLVSALAVSFKVLKIIMVVVLVLFVTSGIFRVQEDEKALVLRLGKISGVGESRVRGPGLQFALPEPINEIVRIPVTRVQTLPIDSFWFFVPELDKFGKPKQRRPRQVLDPTYDGYCLTRNDSIIGQGGSDYNIVHSKWRLTYRIDDPELFFKNIYYRAPRPGEDFLDAASETVNPLLETMAEDAIVTTMVNYSIDEAIVSNDRIPDGVQRLLQKKLDQIDSGIIIDDVQISGKITWPRQVHAAFEDSNKASQRKLQLIIEARSYAEKTLSKAGGADAEKILNRLKDKSISEEAKVRLLSQLAGTCRVKIAEARAYRTKIVETAKANAEYLAMLLPEYRKRPRLVLQKIYQDAIEEVLDNVEEKIFIQPAANGKQREFRVLINRNPEIRQSKPKQEQ